MDGITWVWADARRGFLCSLPAVPIALATSVSLGALFALGTLPVAMLPLAPARAGRVKSIVVAVVFALFYSAGSTCALVPAIAVVAMFPVAYGCVVAQLRAPAAVVLPVIAAPAFALGMNHQAPDGYLLALVFLVGGAWATIIAVLSPSPVSATPRSRGSLGASRPGAVRRYGVLFASAATIGVAAAYSANLTHPAWTAAAAMFVMRPDPDLVARRTVGRVGATVAGVLLAAVIYESGVRDIVVALIAVASVTAMVAVRTSRWYISSAGSGLVVILMAGVASSDTFIHAFGDRIVETIAGAALALIFGVAAPKAFERRARRVTPIAPA
jgi:hypothetical protein